MELELGLLYILDEVQLEMTGYGYVLVFGASSLCIVVWNDDCAEDRMKDSFQRNFLDCALLTC